MGKVIIRTGMRSISAGIAALAMGFSADPAGTRAADPADAVLPGERAGISVFGTIHPKLAEFRAPLGSHIPDNPDIRLASLETGIVSAPAAEEGASEAVAVGELRATFNERFFFDDRDVSFDQRFAATGVSYAPAETEQRTDQIALYPAMREITPPAPSRPAPQLAALSPPPPAAAAKTRAPAAAVRKDSISPDVGSRTAIYDIAAHTVYLPDGRRLEAHSGLGGHMDDPSAIHVKHQGPTPPNVYDLALRERLFHGVRAIRLIPADSGKMYGRDGMLAHTYMLGPNGQSNGCVSFADYSAFLNAFLNGEVDRLVVVDRLADPPSPKAASGWLPEAIKRLFKIS